MPTQIDWCNRCAAAVFDVDGCQGSCSCPEGQLKQLLARTKGGQTRQVVNPIARAAPLPPPRVPVLAHLKDVRVVNPFTPAPVRTASVQAPPVARLMGMRTAAQTELQRAQSLSSVFMREDEEGAPTAPTMADGALEALWSTESSEADMDILGSTRTAAAAPAADANLEALWMGRVARETGMDPSDVPSLDAIWMNEIQNGRTAGTSDISFDSDMDSEIASYPQGGGSARPFSVMAPPPRAPISGPRVQIGQAGRFAVMAESETVMTRTAARTQAEAQGRASMGAPLPIVVPYNQRGGSVQNFRDARAAAQASAPPPRRESAIDRAAAYTSRMTSYQHLMSDD